MELFRNIFFNTDKIVENTDVKVTYAGELFQNGSKNVQVRYGFGDNWENAGEIPMEKSELGYQANIHINQDSKLNFCFKNEKNEWDNNNGQNYSFTIEKENGYECTAKNGKKGAYAYKNVDYGNNTANPCDTVNYTNNTGNVNNATNYANNTTNSYKTINYNNAINTNSPAANTYNVPNYTNNAGSVYGTVNYNNPNANIPNDCNVNKNENYNQTTSLCKITPTWGELIKKTFDNFVNYMSKVFTGKGANFGNNNKN